MIFTLFSSNRIGSVFGVFSIIFLCGGLLTGILLLLIINKRFVQGCSKSNLKKKSIVRIHCLIWFLSTICAIIHGIFYFYECGTLLSYLWIPIWLMIASCLTGLLFPKIGKILPNNEWKTKKLVLRIIHSILQIAIIFSLILFHLILFHH